MGEIENNLLGKNEKIVDFLTSTRICIKHFKSLEKWYNFSDAQFLSQSKRERMNTELYFAFIIWRLSANECIIFIIKPGRS